MATKKEKAKGFKNKSDLNKDKKNTVDNSDLEIKALTYIQKQRYDSAIEIYKKLINQKTNNPIVYSNLGSLYWRKGDHEQSKKLINKALKIKPQYPEALNNLGLIYKKERKLKESMLLFKKAIELNNNYYTIL